MPYTNFRVKNSHGSVVIDLGLDIANPNDSSPIFHPQDYSNLYNQPGAQAVRVVPARVIYIIEELSAEEKRKILLKIQVDAPILGIDELENLSDAELKSILIDISDDDERVGVECRILVATTASYSETVIDPEKLMDDSDDIAGLPCPPYTHPGGQFLGTPIPSS